MVLSLYLVTTPGFLDLNSRLADVVSMLELGPKWLEPNKFDLTFTNVKTQKCIINNTEVSAANSCVIRELSKLGKATEI